MRRTSYTVDLFRIFGVAAVAVLGACSGSGAPAAVPEQGVASDATVAADSAPPTTGGAESGGPTPKPPTTPTTVRRPAGVSGRPSGIPGMPPIGAPGRSLTPPVPGEYSDDEVFGAQDWETKHRIPPGWTLVTQGRTADDDGEWRMYAQQQGDGSACYGLSMELSTGGGGAQNCARPFKVSGSYAPNGGPRFLFGLAPSNAATVVVEHSGAAAETFPALDRSGFAMRLFAGEIGRAPITRVVAYDKAGTKVAERTDVTNLNAA